MYSNKFILVLIMAFFVQDLCSQTDKVIEPILLDKSTLSGVGLKKRELKNEPEKEMFQTRLYKGEELSVFVVSTQTWNNVNENYPIDEYVFLIQGQSIVKPLNGNSKLFNPGDHFLVPRGFDGEWEIRAGDHLHYELAVISTDRADSSKVVRGGTFTDFNKDIGGCQIVFDDNGKYSETLFRGIELTVDLKAVRPSESDISSPSQEKLIHILSGMITITDRNGKKHDFYTGDYMLLPSGMSGSWKSQGHGMVKYLEITSSL